MFRRGGCFSPSGHLLAATISCLDALNKNLEDVSFWSNYHSLRLQSEQQQDKNIKTKDFDLVSTVATATLECLEPLHVGSIGTASRAMKRWSEIDQSDEVTQLLAYDRESRENLCDAIITHQQNTEFVVYACRAITNMALLPSSSSTSSSPSTNNEVEHLKIFAEKGVLDILVKVLVRTDLFDVVPNGRGAAWVLQALQNLILKSDLAAEKCADFGGSERRRVNPDSLSNAEHDELSQESTAEHFLSVAVLRLLDNFTAAARALQRKNGGRFPFLADAREDEEFVVLERIASVSLDSALASIARLLSMSADRGTGTGGASSETTIQHRAEFASPQVFGAVVRALAKLSHSQLVERTGGDIGTAVVHCSLFVTPALEHKCWECMRQLVAVRENIPPLLSALHAADGQSGMRILSMWLESTESELINTLFPSGKSEDELNNKERRHEVIQRTFCGFDVLNELTNASTNAMAAPSSPDQQEKVNKEYDYEKKQLEDMGMSDDASGEDTVSVSSDDAKTQRWESAMQSITSGTLSKFCVSMLMSLHEKEQEHASNSNINDKELSLTLGEVKVKCLSLLLHLSQNDTFVRSANCIVVLQRSVIKPFLKLLAKKQMMTTGGSDENKLNQDFYYGSLLMCQQKTLSLIWNCLNFSDSLKVVQEMRIQQDVELIVKFCCSTKTTPRPEEEGLKAAGEKLLEKMRIVYLQLQQEQQNPRQNNTNEAEGKSNVKK